MLKGQTSTEHCSRFKFSSQDVFSSSAELARLARWDQDITPQEYCNTAKSNTLSRGTVLKNNRNENTLGWRSSMSPDWSSWPPSWSRRPRSSGASLPRTMDILTAGEILVGPLDNNIYNCLETCFSFLLIPIADCKQSQQIFDYKF